DVGEEHVQGVGQTLFRIADQHQARHRKKFAESRVENSDPDYLARHRKKFKNTDADDMGEC
ncbi:hypothetical protein CH338_11605, partial [Rhodoplanes elegans]